MFLYYGRDWETDNDLNNPSSLRPCVREESRLTDWKVEVELHSNYCFYEKHCLEMSFVYDYNINTYTYLDVCLCIHLHVCVAMFPICE